jgi:hypothetical protein
LNGKADALTRRFQDVLKLDDPRVRQQERVFIDPEFINLSPVVVKNKKRAKFPSLNKFFA